MIQQSKSKLARKVRLQFPEAANDPPEGFIPAGDDFPEPHMRRLDRHALMGVLLTLLGWPLTALLFGLILGIARGLSS